MSIADRMQKVETTSLYLPEKGRSAITRSSDEHAATPDRQPLLDQRRMIGDAKSASQSPIPAIPELHHHRSAGPYDLVPRGSFLGKLSPAWDRWRDPRRPVFNAGSSRDSRWKATTLSSPSLLVLALLLVMWYLYPFLLSLFPASTPLVLKDEVGKLPALGWNSWNAYHCDITELQFLTAAEKFIDLGLKDAGYEYVNIDDCWQIKDRRDNVTNRLIPDPTRFPDGIKGTADKIHDLGLKIGIYSSAGDLTCAGYQASINREYIDAATWAEWGIDYLKYDNCNVPANWTDACEGCVPEWPRSNINGSCTDSRNYCPSGWDYSKSLTAERFRIMRDALLAQNRTILYSLCEWGEAGVQEWGRDVGSSWRMSGDIDPRWERIVEILNENSFYLNNVDFWGHSDADMLEVGNGITIQEARSHFALWAAMKSPLLIGTDLARIDAAQLEVLKNKYLLAFNQDGTYGAPAKPYKWGTNPNWTFNASFPAEFWSGASTTGTLVLLFNPYSTSKNKTADWKEIPELDEGASYQVTDIWSGRNLGCVKANLTIEVEGHDTAGLLVGSKCKYRTPKWRGLGFFGW